MAFNQKGGPEQIGSIVGEETVFKGEISSTRSLFINGTVEGKVDAGADVFISSKGRVVGDVVGSKIVVSGEVDGNIYAKSGLEITKSGKVKGEITCDKLLIEDGSVYQGRVNVGAETLERATEPVNV